VITDGNEEGLLVGGQDELGSGLGIGVLLEVHYRRRVMKVCPGQKPVTHPLQARMKVYTPVKSKNVATILIGQIKLTKNGKEIHPRI